MHKVIKEIINSRNQPLTVFVLKGFDLEDIGIAKTSLNESIGDKALSRFMGLTTQSQCVISYEEFIALYSFITNHYKKIIIIENPLYINMYPVYTEISSDITNFLLCHYDESIDEETKLSDITSYLEIFNNYVKLENGIACSYNIEDYKLKSEKIEILVLSLNSEALPEAKNGENCIYKNICNEIDYLNLISLLNNTEDNYAIEFENFNLGKDTIIDKLQLLVSVFPKRLFVSTSEQNANEDIDKYPEISEIMNKYWGYSSFKNLKTYDLNELKNGSKKIKIISQKRIINDLIEQVENSIKEKSTRSHKDIFVTAPTGAGKSLMFQLPAIYIAEKYELVTLVITPLISLMNDQVEELKRRGYTYARTINSDISPIVKQEILEDVANKKCHILYLSPESLLSRSDIEQLIGKRCIGMIIVDEAHIVTTWGKQFRPDYWFLGDHVQKIRNAQDKRYKKSFVVATFTATAIYGGKEDMYSETKNSMHMFDPITYLGYLKRDNIKIDISEVEKESNKEEYEKNKFDSLIQYIIRPSLARDQKTLIYFPTVTLIKRFHNYCYTKNLYKYIAIYHGQLNAIDKKENSADFRSGKKLVMLATKAFGMGINIPDISIVGHFAPTGNVCDYMQEIGRGARKPEINGLAIYKHMSNDFKHINRLHGLSAIKNYQLVNVIKKIYELYLEYRYKNNSNGMQFTKKNNAMLLDTESFSYIFNGPMAEENDLINKVKTAMLLIQKDYENKSFAPFYMRPIPLFKYGFLALEKPIQIILNHKYGNIVSEVYDKLHVCKVDLESIWRRSYQSLMSFPKFKYLLYTNNKELSFNQLYNFYIAMAVEIILDVKANQNYKLYINGLKEIVRKSTNENKFYGFDELKNLLAKKCNQISEYKAESILGVFIASIDVFKKEYSRKTSSVIYKTKILKDEKVTYLFDPSASDFFDWVDDRFTFIKNNIVDSYLYITFLHNNSFAKEIITVLGILESISVLTFKSLGGSNSQIYIYVNETKTMQMVSEKPYKYKNRLLEIINERHHESVKMLSYLYQNNFTSDEIWEHLENYFLGIIPENLRDDSQSALNKSIENLADAPIKFEFGGDLKSDYKNWYGVSCLYDSDIKIINELTNSDIPLADFYGSKLLIEDKEIDCCFVWYEEKIALTTGEENATLRDIVKTSGWQCIPISDVNLKDLRLLVK